MSKCSSYGKNTCTYGQHVSLPNRETDGVQVKIFKTRMAKFRADSSRKTELVKKFDKNVFIVDIAEIIKEI